MKRKIVFEMDEIWKEIKRFPAYVVSNFGRVKRIKKDRGARIGRILKSRVNRGGYLYVFLYKNGKAKNVYVHKLVSETFIGLRPEGYEVNHIDGDKINPYVKNLEYVTKSENRKHAYKIGLRKGMKGEKHPLNKLKEKDVSKIRRLYKTGNYTQKKLANIFNCTYQNIGGIVRNECWKHIKLCIENGVF